MRTVTREAQLDALPQGARVRFTVSGAICTKTLGGLWTIEGHKGAYMPDELTMNGTPLEVLD